MKIVTVVGARPQFVKAAVLSREISKHSAINEVIIHTGQHFDPNMSEVFFQEMSIPQPNYNLDINGLSHGAMTGKMLEEIEKILIKEHPDCLLVYGDTNSTLAGALAAKKLGIRVAHVEAGLRSFNMSMPEEINRILTDRVSDLLFCPSDSAVNQLKKEGFDHFPCQIFNVGDVMQDAALFYANRAKKVEFSLPETFNLCTIHRAESTDDKERLLQIFKALEIISADTTVVIPLHPRTKDRLTSYGYNFPKSNIIFIDPVGYLEMVWLIKYCNIVLTDSGGLQKEAYFFSKPCVTLREETEWIELVNHGFNVIAGYDTDEILQKYYDLNRSNSFDFSIRLYGDGDAGERIVHELRNI